MKGKMLYILVIFMSAFLLMGCTNTDTSTEEEPTESAEIIEPEDVGQVADTEEEVNDPEVVSEEPATVESSETTVQQPLYELDNYYYLKPIEDAPANVVLLTIDDAPDKYALEMAQTLKNLDVGAIFFVNGHFLNTDDKKAVLKEIHEMGFPIGNHTMNHENLKNLSEEEQKEQIVELNNLVESITGERPKYFRAPFGANTDYSRALAAEEKMLVMNWSYGYDFVKEYMNKEAITDIMINAKELRDGANLLMHDREWTNEALEDIVKGLQTKGYEIVDPDLLQTPE